MSTIESKLTPDQRNERDRLMRLIQGYGHLYWEEVYEHRHPELVEADLDRDLVQALLHQTVQAIRPLIGVTSLLEQRGESSRSDIRDMLRKPAPSLETVDKSTLAEYERLAMTYGGAKRLTPDLASQLQTLLVMIREARLDDDELWLTRAAISYCHKVWRNTALEEWHSQSWGLRDGEMMRANSTAVKLIRGMIVEGSSWTAIADAVTSPSRQLPDGRTLKEYARKKLVKLRREASSYARTVEMIELEVGRQGVIDMLAGEKFFTADDWHGTPRFEAKVDAFCSVVDDLDSPFWDTHREHDAWPLAPRPADIADTAELRRLLLEGPELLSLEAAQWCIDASLEYAEAKVRYMVTPA